ncbi:DNA mismatch repair protein MutS [Bacillaceae bacterium]
MKEYTPMIQQYLSIKENYPDALLFFRLGDFYELFFDDAILASRELEITLTGRDGGTDERIPMCGVPYHSADAYVAQLIDKGYKVAICEQVEDPKEAKGVVRREVVRVVTPGTVMDGKLIQDKKNNYLAAVYSDGLAYGLAACDLTTGEFYATAVEQGLEALLDELVPYSPSELIVAGEALAEEDVQRLKQQFSCLLTCIAPDEWRAIDAQREVDEQFGEGKTDLSSLLLQTAGILLAYLKQTQKRSLQHISSIHTYEANQYMMLDQHSRRNLELVETIREKTKKGSLLWLLDETVTAMGGRMLRRWIERPLLHRAAIEARLNAVEFLADHLLVREELREYLRQVYDLERLAGRVAYGNANARDLVHLKKSLLVIPAIKQAFSGCETAELSGLIDRLDPCEDLAELLERSLVENPPLSVKEGGLIKEGYHEYLDRLKKASREGKQWIADLENKERQATGIKSLKVGYNKVFGYYIEVTKPNLSAVPEGRYERKQTLANAERFVTRELKEKEALILEAEEKMVDLEYELFVEIRSKVAAEIPRLQSLANLLATLDVYQSFATVSAQRRFVRPEISETSRLRIEEGRHPVVEAVLDRPFVANDASLDCHERQILLITGPNMAGKSTYMRQIALTIIMAQIGCFVPAKRAEIPITDRIFTRIGAADDLVGGHSTFMVEMMETKNAISRATKDSLILLDEIGRGTSTYDGMALAQAVVEYIHDHVGAKTLFSTHYHELTRLEAELPRLVNVHAKCIEKDGKVEFLHRIEEGKADKSYGIHVAELAQMPSAVIERAKQILEQLEAGTFGEASGHESFQLSFDHWLETAAASAPALSAGEEDVLRELKALDLNNVTPLEALNMLFAWQRKLRGEANG